jgi:hypothetical protein
MHKPMRKKLDLHTQLNMQNYSKDKLNYITQVQKNRICTHFMKDELLKVLVQQNQ